MKTANTNISEIDACKIDEHAIAALNNEVEFERLFQKFEPFLLSRASRLASRSGDIRDDMIQAARMAFYESIRLYDQNKGHFFQYMNLVVHNRLIDCLRKLYNKRVATVPLDNGDDDGERACSNIDEASLLAYRENERRHYLELEIDCFNIELSEWDITEDALIEAAPKYSRLKGIYRGIISAIVKDAEIMQIILTKHYFPIKKISVLTKVPQKTIERGRRYIIASIIILLGDYVYLKEYVEGGMTNASKSGRGGQL